MNRIDKKFKVLKNKKKKAFIAYITAGDPDLVTTEKIVIAIEKSGADIIELGIPFSDPIADGPTIQAASQRALNNGASLRKIFKLMERIRKKTDIPIIFMTYYNPVLKYGISDFFKTCSDTDVDGVIVPDLPPEEAGDLVKAGKAHGINTIFLIAPTSPHNRIKDIARKSRGFIYYVSLTGVTGARAALPAELTSKIRLVKSLADKPVAVGFGVSNAKQAAMVAKVADGVIVGSAIIRIIAEKNNIISRVSKFTTTLARAIHRA